MKCTDQFLIFNWSIIDIFVFKLYKNLIRMIESLQKHSIIAIKIRCELNKDSYINELDFVLISDRSLEFACCRVINSLFNIVGESLVIPCLKPDLMILMGELLVIVYQSRLLQMLVLLLY